MPRVDVAYLQRKTGRRFESYFALHFAWVFRAHPLTNTESQRFITYGQFLGAGWETYDRIISAGGDILYGMDATYMVTPITMARRTDNTLGAYALDTTQEETTTVPAALAVTSDNAWVIAYTARPANHGYSDADRRSRRRLGLRAHPTDEAP